MTIRHLRIFIEVAKTGNMSLAGENLFISQPTVSQVIRELENHYGAMLFDRLSKKLYITEFGKELLRYAIDVVDQFDNLEKAMNNSSNIENLRIGASVTVGTYILSKVLKEFHKIAPNVNTYSYVNNTSTVEKKLIKSELDMAIVEGDIQSPDLITIPVIDDYLVLLCKNNHSILDNKNLQLTDLKNQRFAVREGGSGTRDFLEHLLSKHKISVQIAWEASSTDTIKRAILDDNCLSLLSIHTFEEDILDNKIQIINNINLSPFKRSFKLVYHKDKILSSSMKVLEDLLRKYKYSDMMENLILHK
ncbi:LysR family transcriptional regulator [Terrisporobacter sp.]|uniref:LysR family transcriptional regulator n=1 Tax=Terrisporobacter sp. TaxID=1965305 RepID=UPI0026246E23|nr:LysR family transcriptional regulator [Terrisporobacter sp.]